MDRRRFLLASAASGIAAGVHAQSAKAAQRLPRVGILGMRTDSGPSEALLQGLRDYGYVDGRTVVVDQPDARGREELLPELVAGLVRRNVDLILVLGPAPLAPALMATKTIPLVMVASSADPVAEGIASSLARPGGNVTGLAYAETDRFKKQLEVLKSVAAHASRVAVLWDFDVDVFRRQWAAPLRHAADHLQMSVDPPTLVRDVSDLDGAFASIRQRGANAVLVAAGGILLSLRQGVARLAIDHRLPGIAAFKQFPRAGLLVSYGPDLFEINRRAAYYVDRILKGAKPGDLPIELPSKHELVVNVATARALDLALPPSLLLRADEVVQ